MPNNGNYSFEDMMAILLENSRRRINCCKIGRIEHFYPENKEVDVTIQHKTRLPDGSISDNLLIPGVPLLGNRITLPIEIGEYCLVLFNDYDQDLWYMDGHSGEPASHRSHDITDAFAITGLNGLFNRLANYDTQNIALNHSTKINGDLEVTHNITINLNVTVKGDTDLGGRVTLSWKGPGDPNAFCCLPNCLFSGAVHCTNTTG